jgi:hypothetical protein
MTNVVRYHPLNLLPLRKYLFIGWEMECPAVVFRCGRFS